LEKERDELRRELNEAHRKLKLKEKELAEQQKNSLIAIEKAKKNHEEEVLRSLSGVISQNQLDIILKKKKAVHWSTDDISKAFALRYFGVRGYTFLREKLNYPLPGLSSLRRWASRMDMRSGMLHDVFRLMAANSFDLSDLDRLTILQFDEMKVARTFEYDRVRDQVIGRHSQMQVVMARGLIKKWKQPVFVDFDKKMTTSLLIDIIKELDKNNCTVCAIVSDCGGGNVGLWRQLDISTEKTYFIHPLDSKKKMFVFADPPHLIKLVRNWFLDTGFVLGNGDLLSK